VNSERREKMKFKEKLGKEMLICDGAMGTLLIENGLKAGELPELWNIEHPDILYKIHKQYVDAGADIISANTFGANRLKLDGTGHSVEEIITEGVNIAKKATENAGRDVYVALDMSTTGKLLEPYGDLPFEEAYDIFKQQAVAGEKAGADLVLLETMGDLYEIKAATLAIKENTDLPLIVSMIFNEKGQLLTGADVKTAVFTLEGLGVDMIGLNCGLGPKEMFEHVEETVKYSSTPVLVNPNAGLPECVNGVTSYKVGAEEFSDEMEKIARLGVYCVGGCCGTTPEHIRMTAEKCKKIPLSPVKVKHFTAVTSYSKTTLIGEKPVIIGERINPTGKKKLKAALVENNMDYIVSEAVAQADKKADVLDVNVGLPEIDEPQMLVRAIKTVQSVLNVPLQIDTSDFEAMEKALRIYNGKPLINSTNGKKESMEKVFPLAKKYGGVVVCLTLDENGIPDTAKGRIEIAERMIKTAESYGLTKDDLVIDALAMTVSTGKDNAKVTLETLDYVRNTLGVNTCLGVSNISFGLPSREIINTAFFTMAMHSGLSAGIINPLSDMMMNAYYSYCALKGYDDNCENYINNIAKVEAVSSGETVDLKTAIIKGMKAQSGECAKAMLGNTNPLEVIDGYIIPALDVVGQAFETGKMFLPQLLMSADCAKAAFDEIKLKLIADGTKQEPKGKIVIATVKGDIHDIGKNIVKVLLENYGFDVIDLGKDVDPELVVETAKREKVKLVGLSALMTTTVANMEITIKQLREAYPECKVIVGGAVLTQDYADRIGADFYSKDAMGSVRYAERLFTEN
jgi:5-methyltetrahydrofolate--homocysteine methyltransferase